MESLLDEQLKFWRKFKLLFNVMNYFQIKEREEKILGVPFTIGAKSLNFQCPLIRQKTIDREKYYYCVNEDHIQVHARTGQKITTCNECPINDELIIN